MSEEKFSAEDLALIADPVAETPAASEAPASEVKAESAAQTQEAKADHAPEAKAAPKTVLDDAGDGDTPPAKGEADKADPAKPGEQPAAGNWREEFADSILARMKDKIPEDKIASRRTAILNQLGRYKTQADYMTAGFAAQERIRSGELRSKLGDDASDEEKAEWRKENGLPTKAEEYDFPKIAGHKWTEADKPLIDEFKKVAFSRDMTQEQLNGAAEWYAATVVQQQQEYQERIAQVDSEDGENMRSQMRAELGVDYKPTAALLRRGLEDRSLLSEDATTALVSGRYTDKDGVSRRLINNPDILHLLTSHFRDVYGDASLVRGDGTPTSQSVIDEGEKIMNTDIDRYYREGWADKVLAARQEEEKAATRRGRKAA